jgi:nucleoside-diphosphate-sugar epimerase
MVWDLTLFWCHKYSLSAVKIVVPNPYGELENEDRLLPVFAKKIMNGESLVLNDPKAVRNNIRVSELAKFYLKAIQDFKEEGFSFEEIKPHGYIETQKDFVERALQERPYNLSLDEIRKYVKML